MAEKQRLGELLIKQGLVTQDVIDDALRVQTGGNRRVGHILVRMGVLSEDRLVETLAEQLGVEITLVEREFNNDVKKVLPRYLCTKYSVLPLTLENNNILRLAMADPSDHTAIRDIEHYTKRVVEPLLARHSDINREVKKNIPLSLKDVFNPQAGARFTRVVAAAALVLVIGLGMVTYNYIDTAQHGTVSHVNDAIIYKHLDLMLGFDASGKISLLGHSAFSDGYYSVSFKDSGTLEAFVASRQADFSSKQKKWLDWVLTDVNDTFPVKKKIADASQ